MPRKLVTLEDITLMNELYKQIGTYAGVARQVGFSASTVAKYIQKDDGISFNSLNIVSSLLLSAPRPHQVGFF